MSGVHPYARLAYAQALAGAEALPAPVAEWGTPILSRPVPAGGVDAVGPYPMTVLAADADLECGFDTLARAGMISVVFVGDPLASRPSETAFDIVRPFKTHHLVDPRSYAPSKHHRAEIRRSLAKCVVDRVELGDLLPVWTQLYGGLVERHSIAGVSAFTPDYFRHLSETPELVALAARIDGGIVAMGLWFAHEGVAYNHLGASSEAGYAAGASYAIYDAAIAHFVGCRAINLGGGAGFGDDPSDGLARFKRGFANDAVEARLYGKVLDASRYAELSHGLQTSFFPSYRDPSAGVHDARTAAATLAMSATS